MQDILIQITAFQSTAHVSSWSYQKSKCIYLNFQIPPIVSQNQYCLEVQCFLRQNTFLFIETLCKSKQQNRYCQQVMTQNNIPFEKERMVA